MSEQSETQIALYIDGEMDSAARAAFEAELEQQPELAAQVAQWRANDAALRAVIAERPVDAALLERLGLSGDSVAPSARIIDFAAARAERVVHAPPAAASGRGVKPRWIAGGAIAAALALTVSIKMMTATPGYSNDPAFQVAMQENAMGQSTPIGDGAVVPVLSFSASDGRFCREYRIEGANVVTGIACRAERRWTSEAEVQTANAPDATAIVAASGETSATIDAAYARLRGGDPLDATQERALIASGWRTR